LEAGIKNPLTMIKKLIILSIFLLSVAACSLKKNNGKPNPNLLPESSGEYGEIVIIVNKDKWNGDLGESLKEVFHGYIPGLTRPEPFFTTRIIEPFQFNRIFRLAKNIVYVTSFEGTKPADKWLQNTFNEEAKQMVMNDTSQFMRTQDDQFALGQKVLRLFAKDDATLKEKLEDNKDIIRNYFNIAEKERLAEDLRSSTAGRKIAGRLKDKFGYNIKVPAGYEEVPLDKDDFAWVRVLPNVGASKNIFVYFKPYESADEFTHENIIKLRNKIGKDYIFGDPDNLNSFMTTEEKYVPIIQRDINFAGNYTVETKGAWKTNNLSVGGTFVSYTFVDQESNRLYYIEGFIIHPNESHRELIREMESILTTFRPVKNQTQAGL
jgi:uncharacterized protein DUF4837